MRRFFLAVLVLTAPAWADGQFSVHFRPSQREVGERIRAIQEFQQVWFAIAKALNDTFVLPRDLPIVFMDIGQANAFYTPDKHAIVVGYEMFEELANAYRPMSSTQEELGNHLLGGILFIFFHELGHCLVGELGLPATGREEDAVDEFSALLLADVPQGQNCIVSAAAYFAATASSPTPQAYFDEHSLNQQRVTTLVTILYASNPQMWGGLCQQMGVPERTLARAQNDYPKKQKAWTTLLAPHMEPGAR